MDNNILEAEEHVNLTADDKGEVEIVQGHDNVSCTDSVVVEEVERNQTRDLEIQTIELMEKLEVKNREITEINTICQKMKEEYDKEQLKLVEERKALSAKEEYIEKQVADLQEKDTKLKASQANLEQDIKNIQAKQQELSENERKIQCRELVISEKEAVYEQELTKRRIALDTELLDKKRAFEKELSEEKQKHISELSIKFTELRTEFEESLDAERKDRLNQINDSLNKERKLRIATLDAEIADKTTEMNHKAEQLAKEKNQLEGEKEKLEQEKSDLEVLKRRNGRKSQQLDEREEEIENTVRERIQDTVATLNNRIETILSECSDLREQLRLANQEQQKLQTIKAAYGSDPTIFVKTIQDLRTSNEQLSQELASRPSKELGEKYEQLKRENEQLRNEVLNIGEQNKSFIKSQEGISKIEIENQMLISEKSNLISQVEELESQCENLRARISRLSSVDGRLSDRDERIREIKSGYIHNTFNSNLPNKTNEVDWLEDIRLNCRSYGITFPKRILYAFHTALKISDWSSVTVLAGVSGTGKSELPRLYSAFGGLNFINVPVQPNWDSQESMLGFFNSIDNRFDAQPLLRFLVECTEDENYNDYMSIVLLDEMNLAHVEHYFAEFLSKLESRRGTSKGSVPTIEVKLGAGVEPYQLKISRTVLWTGTMNQDETTKSLSDKVLDRGIVINFPRPRELSSRKNMGSLEKIIENTNRSMLKKSTWAKWIVREIKFEGEQLDELRKYKKIVEEINDALEGVGRALGHRVWQSIEYYIANYPLVVEAQKEANGELSGELKEAMKIAFEDQIVQKIMPKLRGIETRSKGGEKLSDIEALLEREGFEKLKDDFDIACEQGYGQFIWSSAKYIEADIDESVDELHPGNEECPEEDEEE